MPAPMIEIETGSQLVSLHVHGHIVLLVQTDVTVTDEVQGVYVSSCLGRSSEGK